MKLSHIVIIGGLGAAALYLLSKTKAGIAGSGLGSSFIKGVGSTVGGGIGAVAQVPYQVVEGTGEGISESVTGLKRADVVKSTGTYYQKAETEIKRVTGLKPTPKQIVSRSAAMGAAETLHKKGMVSSLFTAPVTIGQGLGAIIQQQKYYESLPTKELKEKAFLKEAQTRQDWMRTHPLETIIGSPALVIHELTKPAEMVENPLTTFRRGIKNIFGF